MFYKIPKIFSNNDGSWDHSKMLYSTEEYDEGIFLTLKIYIYFSLIMID